MAQSRRASARLPLPLLLAYLVGEPPGRGAQFQFRVQAGCLSTSDQSHQLRANTLAGQPLAPDALLKYTANVSKVDTAWAALEDIAGAMPIPAALTAAMNKAKQDYFASDYQALRTKALKALVAGEPPGAVSS